MKIFWALVALLLVATVVMFATDLGGTRQAVVPSTAPASPAPAPVAIASRPPEPPPPEPTPAEPVAAAPVPASIPPTAPTEQSTPTPVAAAPVQAPPAEAPATTTPPPPEAVAPVSGNVNPALPSAEDENLLIKLRQEIEAERAKREAERAAREAAAAPPEAPASPPPGAGATGIFGAAPAEQKPDGSILVEGKYLVKGKGTQEDPYKITWDQLISAERDYAPKDGKKTIPARIEALNGTWVEITGYITFPLMADETDELLAMMNQWDGCCIGIPPTPYDAIEVRLSSAVSGDGRLTTYGSIKGKFKVDPHLVGGWLVGLYVIDQGKLTPVQYGGVAP